MLVRVASVELPVLEIVFLRNLLGVLLMLPLVYRPGRPGLRTNNHRLFFARGLLAFIAMAANYTAFKYLALADATVLSFTAPLFAVIAAMFVLNENVRRPRWIATIVGFGGALLVLRPGFHDIGWADGAILLAAAITGTNNILVKQLTRTERSSVIVTYMTLYGLPFSLLAALPDWVAPSSQGWLLIAALAVSSTLGNLALTRAFQAWDASAVVAFDFARLPITVLLAWLVFAEVPGPFLWIGAAVIIASLFYEAHQEVRQRSRPLVTDAGESL